VTTAQLIIICVAAIVIAILVAKLIGTALFNQRLANVASLPGPSLVGRTVVVHTRRPDDQSVRGVLVAHHTDRLVLREAVYVHASGSQDAGGLIHVPLLGVSTVQEIEPPAESG
jgi:hypothetical protein